MTSPSNSYLWLFLILLSVAACSSDATLSLPKLHHRKVREDTTTAAEAAAETSTAAEASAAANAVDSHTSTDNSTHQNEDHHEDQHEEDHHDEHEGNSTSINGTLRSTPDPHKSSISGGLDNMNTVIPSASTTEDIGNLHSTIPKNFSSTQQQNSTLAPDKNDTTADEYFKQEDVTTNPSSKTTHLSSVSTNGSSTATSASVGGTGDVNTTASDLGHHDDTNLNSNFEESATNRSHTLNETTTPTTLAALVAKTNISIEVATSTVMTTAATSTTGLNSAMPESDSMKQVFFREESSRMERVLSRLDELEKRVNFMEKRNSRRFLFGLPHYFTAFRKSPLNSTGETITFDDFNTFSTKNLFNLSSGVFRSPIAGTYLFFAMAQDSAAEWNLLTLQKNGLVVASATSPKGHQGTCSLTAIVALCPRDRVTLNLNGPVWSDPNKIVTSVQFGGFIINYSAQATGVCQMTERPPMSPQSTITYKGGSKLPIPGFAPTENFKSIASQGQHFQAQAHHPSHGKFQANDRALMQAPTPAGFGDNNLNL